MCLGIPMRVMECEGVFAWCEGRGRRERLNLLWIGEVQPGEWVYAVLGQARERLDEQRARQIDAGLDALEAVLAGRTEFDPYFDDLLRPD
ncbi:MAG TPA: HypC/HybG/HupF family hydrogenase formation chaperone [Rhodocyclaceae bacterium]|nr:HypC/HybG/HupF family hydrogenase formation chaperone [Rhodocyclaceae bacterium]